jgi:hypothetical protein
MELEIDFVGKYIVELLVGEPSRGWETHINSLKSSG